MAWLIQEDQHGHAITHIRDNWGNLVYSQDEILDVFTSYYRELCGAHLMPLAEILDQFLNRAQLLCLEEKDALGGPILEEKIRAAVGDLVGGKTPGMDGLPAEFYHTYVGDLAPKLTALYAHVLEEGHLPAISQEVLTVSLSKTGGGGEIIRN
ncbi:hypothetical protein NDU88_001093 [Pleurodeles waltl]|uniref:Cullin N-terminal domain-containing protein n=1 Tax=Pleurodeles waltl TaxID=8319 RepID=A0AAV7U5E6_PLEWA|nr:hypothetical protein NDU88_001093 [Pleurodeles waltl]